MSVISLTILFLLTGLILTKCFGRSVKKKAKHFVYFGDGSYSEYQTKKLAIAKVKEVHVEAKKTKAYLRAKNMRKSEIRFAYHNADLMEHTHYSNESPHKGEMNNSKNFDIR
ncbi:hypothetical protein [Vibrio apostichopi]|uniref:hypothetical protein n=1 Tax=Vibrio apostichopi TaxID=3035453 RepID=UPI0025742409|nr:hypothetical protein [Vibrio sp. FE10]